MTDIQISNTLIDSGNWINMKGVSFTPSYKKHNEAIPLDGVSTAALPEGDRIGVDVPQFTIRGIINVDDFASTAELWSETPSALSSTSEDGVSNTNAMTLGYLNSLWREMSGETKIMIYLGNPSSQKTWKNWNNTSDEIYVVVDDINPVPSQDSDGLHFINYTIVCKEVQADGTYTS